MNNIHHKIFKPIPTDDYQITPFKTYKRFSFTPSNYEDMGLQISYGTKITSSRYDSILEPYNGDGSYKGALWDFIHSLYYECIHVSSSIVGDVKYNSLRNYHGEIDNFNKNPIRELNDRFIYIGIPQQLYGEQIKPKSFNLQYHTYNIEDDGYNNLIDINNNNLKVGNIFYGTGNIILNNTGSYYTNFNSLSFNNISYNSQFTIYEHSITCNIRQGEFNTTLNPSCFSGSFPISFNSQSTIYDEDEFDPYITTIGLYNDDNELLMVAKFPKPLKNYKDMDLNILIRLDV